MAKKQRSIAAKKEAPVAKKEVAVKEEKSAIANYEAGSAFDPSQWGANPMSAKDMVIPRILLVQPMSEAVTQGESAFGDLNESLNGKKLGDFKTPVSFVPFFMRKVWVEYDVTAGEDIKNKKFLKVVPVTPQNEALPYKDDSGPQKIMRDYVLEFFVLLEKDLNDDNALPHIVSFRRSSMQAGKKLATQMFVKNIQAKKTPASVTMTLSTKKETNGDSTFAVMDVAPGQPTRQDWIEKAFEWLKIVQAGQVKVDEASYDAEASDVTANSQAAADGPGRF